MHRVLLLLMIPVTAQAAVDARAVHTKIVALDTEFAKVIRTNDLPRYMAAKQKAEDLIGTLGSDPTEPCRTAAVRLKTSRTNEWIDRQGQTLTDTARRVIESNRHDFEEALDACRASAR
jgi:ribosomal protein S16